MENNNEQVRKSAMGQLLIADSFLCVTLKGGNLDIATLINAERLTQMLLAVMRNDPSFAESVYTAAFAHAKETLPQPK